MNTGDSQLKSASQKTIGGRYHLRSVLGQGGFGTVYSALQSPLDRPVAVKVCRATADDASAMEPFEREARIIANLRSPHTVRLYDYGKTDDGYPYFAMELIAGETLASELSVSAMNPSRAARILSEVCESVAEAHAMDILHLDLKPANIMVESISGRGEITRVLDFGIARILGPGDKQNAQPFGVVGTPKYMAPEMLYGNEPSKLTDIYGLGLILDECLRGRPTFSETNTPLLMAKHFDNLPPLPDDTPQGLVDIRDQLLQKKPENRPASVSAVRRSLDQWRTQYGHNGMEQASRTVVILPSGIEPTLDLSHPEKSAVSLATIVSDITIMEQDVSCHLPYHATPFIGRSDLLGDMIQAFSITGQRLVTLAGTGGVGKTRLSIQHGQENQRQYPGGIWFCDLSEVHSLNGVCTSVANALEVPLKLGHPIQQLAKTLAGKKRCLLILDNFEHVVEHAEATLGVWLKKAPLACFLVTSRETLRIPGEHVLSVTPFPMDDAVHLFTEYASRAAPGFECTAENRPIIESIIIELDQIPLAIELAAKRMRTLGLVQLKDRLTQRFRLLKTRGTRVGDRQATMQATIAWSWSLLDPVEQSVCAQASLFRGGFTLEAAEAVIHLPTDDQFELEEVIGALVDKHLIQRRAPLDGMVRFTMYESLREYAAQRQDELDATLALEDDRASGTDAVKARHSAHYSAYAESSRLRSLNGPDARTLLTKYDVEMDNFRLALDDAIRIENFEEASLLTSALLSVYGIQGPLDSAVAIAKKLTQSELPAHLAGPSWAQYAAWCLRQHDGREFEKAVGEAKRHATQLADSRLQLKIANMETFYLASIGQARDIRTTFENHLQRAQDVGDQTLEQHILDTFSKVMCRQGEINSAIPLSERSIELANERQDLRESANHSIHLATMYDQRGERKKAENMYLTALEQHRRLGDRIGLSTALGNLAFLYAAEGRRDESLQRYHEALETQKAVGFGRQEAYTFGNMGDLLADMGREQEAIDYLQKAVTLCDDMEDRLGSGAFRASLALLNAKRGSLDDALAMVDDGQAQLEGIDLIELGVALCKRAHIEILALRRADALANLARARGLAQETDVTAESTLARAIDTVQTLLDS